MPPKILIVDDEPRIRLLLEQTLEDFEDMGVEILTACNGREALEIIRIERPGLVYLDAMMPEMNGYDVCEVGADMYMTKPFDPNAIVVKTIEVLGINMKVI